LEARGSDDGCGRGSRAEAVVAAAVEAAAVTGD